jgi:hypothetical protein
MSDSHIAFKEQEIAPCNQLLGHAVSSPQTSNIEPSGGCRNLRAGYAMIPQEGAMKSTGKKSKQAQAKTSVSRDKVRKMRDDSHAVKKIGKIRTPLAERRSKTRALRHETKEVLKEVQSKLNPS